MASPLNSSRRHSNIAFKVESMSDLPKRRGREMKSCESVFGAASWYSSSVLSTYFPSPPSISLGKSNTPVVGTLILCSAFSIGTYYTKNFPLRQQLLKDSGHIGAHYTKLIGFKPTETSPTPQLVIGRFPDSFTIQASGETE